MRSRGPGHRLGLRAGPDGHCGDGQLHARYVTSDLNVQWWLDRNTTSSWSSWTTADEGQRYRRSLMIDYEKFAADADVDLELRYTNVKLRNSGDLSDVIKGSAAGKAPASGRRRVPTAGCVGPPGRYVLEGAYTRSWAARRGRRRPHGFAGSSIEFDSSATTSGTRWRGLVLQVRPDISGWSLGLAAVSEQRSGCTLGDRALRRFGYQDRSLRDIASIAVRRAQCGCGDAVGNADAVCHRSCACGGCASRASVALFRVGARDRDGRASGREVLVRVLQRLVRVRMRVASLTCSNPERHQAPAPAAPIDGSPARHRNAARRTGDREVGTAGVPRWRNATTKSTRLKP